MREISVQEIRNATADAFIRANLCLPQDLRNRIRQCAAHESKAVAKDVFRDMESNLSAAETLKIPICQDCGMAIVFVELGQDAHIVGGDFTAAINDGVRDGYEKGFLRKSVVCDPLRRNNTGDNTPAIVHTSVVPGDRLTLTCIPKGFGSENMSRIAMMNPSASRDDVIDFVTQTVRLAGAKPCPPLVLGVGIGGDFEYAALLAKKALCRDVSVCHPDPYYAALEADVLRRVNELGIGPQGFSGDTTALAVNIEVFPTHIAGLPVAVNVGCHVTRHLSVVV